MAGGLGSGFARGLMRGYELETQRQRQEKLDKLAERQAEVQMGVARTQQVAAELNIEEARARSAREKTARAADERIQALGEVKAQEMVVPGKKEGETEQVWVVGDQQFGSKAAADMELRRQNSPVAVAKRQYAAAASAGIPELTERYRNNLTQARAAAQADLQEAAMEALRQGPAGINKLYNESVLDGTTEQISYAPDGKIVMATYRAGKRLSDPVTMTPEEYSSYHLARFKANPDSYLENYYRERTYKEGVRQFDAKMGIEREQLGVQRLNAQANQTSAGAAATQAQTGQKRLGLETTMYEDGVKTRPIASTVNLDGSTNLIFNGPAGATRNVKVPGVPAGAVRAMQDNMGMGGAPAAGFQVPDDWVSRMQGLQPGAR